MYIRRSRRKRSGRKMIILPTMFPIGFLIMLSTVFLGESYPPRPVTPRNRVMPSDPVNQMTPQLPVLFPARVKQTGTFFHIVHREAERSSACGEVNDPTRYSAVHRGHPCHYFIRPPPKTGIPGLFGATIRCILKRSQKRTLRALPSLVRSALYLGLDG